MTVTDTFKRISARAPIYLANVRDNPSWLPMFVFGRLLPVRRALWRAAAKAPAGTERSPVFDGTAIGPMVDGLRRDGICRPLQLPAAMVADVLAFARETACFAGLNRSMEFMSREHGAAVERAGRPILVGHFFDRIEQCAAAVALRDDPVLHGIARQYLGAKAQVISHRLWWSFPATGASEAELSLASQEKLHFDLDDWRALKFFFYLTPVGEGSGPHVYVAGSHDRRIVKHQLTLLVGHPNGEVLEAYGADRTVTVLGGAGFGFGVDPFGFHMGTAVRSAPRLMMEVGFGVSGSLGTRFYGEAGGARRR